MSEQKFISGDGHLQITSDPWIDRVPKKHRDRAPRVLRLPDGTDVWSIEGAPLQDVVFGLYAGKGDAFKPFQVTFEGSAGAGPGKQRLAEQDQDNLSAELLFPGANGPPLWRHIRDDDCYLAVIRAYNSFVAEEYCSVDPTRLLGVGVIPWAGVREAITELEYCKDVGLRAVQLGVYPNGSGTPQPEDDAFWAAALDLDMLLTVHTKVDRNRGGGLTKMIDMRDTSERARRQLPNTAIITQLVSGRARDGGVEAMQMAMSGVFDRFPKLEIFFAETDIGWIPFFLEQADLQFHRHANWVERELGWTRVQQLPSEYARRHCYWGFTRDRFGILNRDFIGIERLVWSTDFPHQQTAWPHSMKSIEEDFAGVPSDEIDQMTFLTICRLLRLDPAHYRQ